MSRFLSLVRSAIARASTAALAVVKATPHVFVFGVLVVIVYALLTDRALVVLPVSLPESLEAKGYTPATASQVIAARMAYVAGLETLGDTEQLAIARPAENQPDFDLVAAGAPDLPDIQVPGQPYSFRAVSRFIRGVFGRNDPAVTISITTSDSDYIVRAGALGGTYAGRRQVASVPDSTPPEDMMLTAAALAVGVVQPLRYAAFLEEMANRNDTACPPGLICTADRALVVAGQLLADENSEDDGRAHLLYADLSYGTTRWDDALQHCEAAKADADTRDWASIYCAYSYLGKQDRDEALSTALGAWRPGLNDPDVHAGFGDLFLALERESEARSAYERAVSIEPRHVYSLIGLGTIERRNGRFEGAAARYRAALLVNPNEPYAQGGLGVSLVALGDMESALPYLERALAIDGTYQAAIDAERTARAALGSDVDDSPAEPSTSGAQTVTASSTSATTGSDTVEPVD